MQDKIKNLIEGSLFQNFIIGAIVLNAIILGLETSDIIMADFGKLLLFIDAAILFIFVIEIVLRLYVYRLRFFMQPWSVFDFLIVAIALVPSSGALSALRALRVLRVLRLISVIPSMRKVVEGLLSAVPGMASVTLIISLFFYIFAVIGTHLYAEAFPEWFGNIGRTMYTLFQIMTLESWSMGIVRPVMEQFQYAWIYFIAYIVITTFTTLNLFIAIIVSAMQSGDSEYAEESRHEMRDDILNQLRDMETRILKKDR